MNRTRSKQILFWVSPEEYELIRTKMAQLGTGNMSAYLRKMAIDGYIIKLEMPELREIVSLLRRNGNNLNQLAKRVNATGRIYAEDMADIQQKQEQLWTAANALITKLAKIP